jgi:hypothetical protein
MKPTITENYFAYSGHPMTQACIVCREPYRGSETVSWNIGGGRYRDFPAHAHCKKQIKH